MLEVNGMTKSEYYPNRGEDGDLGKGHGLV